MSWDTIFALIVDCVSPIAWLILFFVSKGKISPELKAQKKIDKNILKSQKYIDKANKIVKKRDLEV